MKTTAFGKIIPGAALSLAMSLATGAALAQEQQDNAANARSISVSYAAGDLDSKDGRANLYARIRQAAENVCGPTDLRGAGSLMVANHNRKCYEAAVQEAVGQVESRQLASLAD